MAFFESSSGDRYFCAFYKRIDGVKYRGTFLLLSPRQYALATMAFTVCLVINIICFSLTVIGFDRASDNNLEDNPLLIAAQIGDVIAFVIPAVVMVSLLRKKIPIVRQELQLIVDKMSSIFLYISVVLFSSIYICINIFIKNYASDPVILALELIAFGGGVFSISRAVKIITL